MKECSTVNNSNKTITIDRFNRWITLDIDKNKLTPDNGICYKISLKNYNEIINECKELGFIIHYETN